MIEAAERTGVNAGGPAPRKSAITRTPGSKRGSARVRKRVAMSKSTRARERRMIVAEVVAIDESWAMRVVPLMVVCQLMLAPIRSPVVPPPAKAREDTDADSQAEHNPWPIDKDAWNVDPTRIKRQ